MSEVFAAMGAIPRAERAIATLAERDGDETETINTIRQLLGDLECERNERRRIADIEWKLQNEAERTADTIARAVELLWRLDAVHADSRYEAVWTNARVHGILYSGPYYRDQMEALRLCLPEEARYAPDARPIATVVPFARTNSEQPGSDKASGDVSND